MKKILILCLLAVAAAALAGCVQSAAAAGKELTIYTALENEQIDNYLVPFKEKYPDIKINIVRDSTGVITAKLVAEGENTSADVVWGTAVSSLLVLDQKGMLEPYEPEGFDRIIEMLKDVKNPTPKWVGINAWETAIVVNTMEAKRLGLPEITSYQDLTRPEFAGQIVMSNPNSSGTGFLTVSGLIQLMGEEEAFAYMDELHKNIAMYTHSGSAPAKKAASGEFAVGISYGYAGTSQIKKDMPVKVIFPAEGSGWDAEGNALIKKAAIKDEAKLFLDWAISDEAMNLLKEDYAITGVKMTDEIPEGYLKDPLDQLIAGNDFYWAAENREAILNRWMEHYDGKSEPKS